MFKVMTTLPLVMYGWFIVSTTLFSGHTQANDNPTVRLGVLKYGTVNWEVDVIKHHKLDQKYNFNLDVLSLGSKNASAVALQSDAVDIILTDWLWVNRQRFNQKDFTLFPTSIATGGVYVANNSTIKDVTGFAGKRIGIAGGEVDKNWLLLRAYAQQQFGFDIKQQASPSFMSPVLLNVLMLRDELDGAINFWHYGARLKTNGYKLLVSVPEMLTALNIKGDVPLLGWAFDISWAQQNSQLVNSFLQASLEAKQILNTSDTEWSRIRGLTKAENDSVFQSLIKDYRGGLLQQFSDAEQQAATQIFNVLAEQGGQSLVGKAISLDPHTFYDIDRKKLTHALLMTHENEQ